jgi:hypothetical protein
MKISLLLAFLFLLPSSACFAADSVIDTYPGLEKFVSTERASNIYFGFGVNPFNLVCNKVGFSASVIQIHWIKDNYDFEIFNGSFGSAFGKDYGSEQYFLLRTSPKYRIFKNISIGPLAGIEFVSFPDVQDELTKNNYFTQPVNFSSVGAVYGFSVAETFNIGTSGSTLLRVSESLYKETYSTVGTKNGWNYYYLSNALNADASPIAATTVFLLEVSYLF